MLGYAIGKYIAYSAWCWIGVRLLVQREKSIPLAMFYGVTNILIAKPGTDESADPFVPFLALGVAFGFAIAAMLVPLLSEFDVALGRTTAAYEE